MWLKRYAEGHFPFMLCFTEWDFAPKWDHWGHFPIPPPPPCKGTWSHFSKLRLDLLQFYPCAGVILFFLFFFSFHYKLQIIICQNVFWVMPFVWPRLCPQLCVLGVCGTVCVLVTQGSGPGLTPPSAPVKVVPRTQLLIKMPGAGTPLTLVLHVKSDKTQCLSVLFCKLFFFFWQNDYFG